MENYKYMAKQNFVCRLMSKICLFDLLIKNIIILCFILTVLDKQTANIIGMCIITSYFHKILKIF